MDITATDCTRHRVVGEASWVLPGGQSPSLFPSFFLNDSQPGSNFSVIVFILALTLLPLDSGLHSSLGL